MNWPLKANYLKHLSRTAWEAGVRVTHPESSAKRDYGPHGICTIGQALNEKAQCKCDQVYIVFGATSRSESRLICCTKRYACQK